MAEQLDMIYHDLENGTSNWQTLIKSIKEKYPNLQLEAQFTGSGAGLEAVASKTTDIGDSSRALTDEEKAKGLEEKYCCYRWYRNNYKQI